MYVFSSTVDCHLRCHVDVDGICWYEIGEWQLARLSGNAQRARTGMRSFTTHPRAGVACVCRFIRRVDGWPTVYY